MKMHFFLIFALFSCASAADYLSFLSLGSSQSVSRGDDDYSAAIYPTDTLRFGSSTESTVYVSTNGYFSLGTSPSYITLSTFSIFRSYSVVAPFAADITTSSTGSVRYNTFTTGDSNINTVSSFIRSELRVSFYGTWMVIADWYFVPQLSGSIFTTNRFQGVIITDGSVSYAVFLYYCPYMEWSRNAVIGWQASSSYYRNHPLSGASNAKQIACLNTASSYNTVLFKLSSVSSCTSSSYFGCFDGDCEYSARCDITSDCSDGSDEVYCSTYGCSSGEFKCDNGNCEPNSYQCDNEDDCGDNSDEQGCVNTGLAVGLSLGLSFLFCFIALPLIIVCVVIFCARRNRRRPVVNTHIVGTVPSSVGNTTVVTSGQNTYANPPAATSGAMYPTQQYPTVVAPPGHPIQQYPQQFKSGPQEAPPPYPGTTYPAYPPPVPQPMHPSYGGQIYPQGPAYPPPTQFSAPPGEGSNAAILLES